MKPDESTQSEIATSHEDRGEASKVEKRPSQRPGGSQSLVGVTVSGRYRIERVLGEGGMGAVYQAEHSHMRKRLAVKVLHPEMSRLPEVVARFEREAMAAAHIDHPNVAAATDFGKLDDGSFFLVLEYVEGRSLRDALGSEGRLELGRALHITFQIALALQRAHALGIVHRDLKPENVMLVARDGDPDFVKVLDFGIAKVPVGALAKTEDNEAPVLTQLGMVYGTPEYMSPEQALGQAVDARADLYALGIMLYEMLAGVRPFDHESKVSLLGMHVTAKVPPFADKAPSAQVPPEVEAIVTKLLAKEAADRFDSAKDVLEVIAHTVAQLVERRRIEPRGAARGAAVSTSSPSLLAMDLAAMGGRGSDPSSQARAGASSAPTLLASEPGRFKLPPWIERRRPLAIGAAGGALGMLALVALLAVHPRQAPRTVTTPDGAVLDVPSEPEPVPSPDDKAIAGALADIDHGDYGSAISALSALEPQHQDRADVHHALERAYLATKNPKLAMGEAGLLVKADPAAAHDPKVLEDVRNVAIGKEGADEAFELLERDFGPSGIDVLYDIAHADWATGYPQAASRAQKILLRPEVRAKASPALGVTLEMRAANTCDARKATFARAREVGDTRTMAVLRSYIPTRGCGFLGTRDCFGCMHRDGSLAATMKAIEDRGTH